jgi:hypothetical protein
VPIDLSKQKFPDFSNDGTTYPNKVTSSPWQRLVPLPTAAELRSLYLFGIPLWSFFPDPVTGKRDKMTDDELRQIIERSVGLIEAQTGCIIAPSEVTDNGPFDRTEYMHYGYIQLNVRPVISLLNLRITTADRQRVFEVPVEWVAVADMVLGRITIQPMGTYTSPLAVSPVGGAPFLMYMSGNANFIPQWWQIRYVAGFKDMLVPEFVARLVGLKAAFDILSMLAATYGFMTGGSLGIDGLSQSSSGPGPQVFAQRIGEIKEEMEMLKKKFKKFAGLALVVGSV